MLYGFRPRFSLLCLEEDNGASGAIEQASSVEAQPVMDTPIEAPSEPEYFHSITIPGDNGSDDEVINFKDPKELSDRYLQNRFRRADYTKKTQELSEQRKQYEKDLEAFRAKETSLTNLSNKYNEFDNLFKDVSAEQMQKIVQQLNGQRAKQTPEMKALEERLKSIEAKEQAEQKKIEAEQKKKAEMETFNSRGRYLKTHYDDYDHDSVMKMYEELNSVTPEAAHQAILEMLYFAGKGKGSLTKPGDPQGPPRTKIAGRGVTPPEKPMTLDEAKQAALNSV